MTKVFEKVNKRQSKKVAVGNIFVGGDTPVCIQSMLNVPAHDVKNSVKQALELEKAGCEIIRAAVPDKEAVKTIAALKENVNIPVVCDIHFDYRLAIECVSVGVDKVRINPGNIGVEENIHAVAKACNAKNIPIRIGVNSGSVEKELLEKFGSPTSEALAESAIKNANMLEKYDFNNIIISVKSSDVVNTYKANMLLSQMCDYPLHLGVTEAGTERMSLIKSSSALGALLLAGVGDTVRISITGDPIREVFAAKDLLSSLGLRQSKVKIVSCPTCGRTSIDLVGLANKVEKALSDYNGKPVKIAVMGCVVNGPGEASNADLGIAGGKNCGIIFKKGKVIKKVDENELLTELLKEVELFNA